MCVCIYIYTCMYVWLRMYAFTHLDQCTRVQDMRVCVCAHQHNWKFIAAWSRRFASIVLPCISVHTSVSCLIRQVGLMQFMVYGLGCGDRTRNPKTSVCQMRLRVPNLFLCNGWGISLQGTESESTCKLFDLRGCSWCRGWVRGAEYKNIEELQSGLGRTVKQDMEKGGITLLS